MATHLVSSIYVTYIVYRLACAYNLLHIYANYTEAVNESHVTLSLLDWSYFDISG